MHQPRLIDCVSYDPTGCGKCNHPSGKSFFGKLPCVLTTHDTRVGSCKVQVSQNKPTSPPKAR